ncbi:MAG: G-D-S-L family lipolytic protein, partial [Ruminococcaceae bacterium]|nr:G-D-S-L family lipolytic protein [Oscillospiraceae bacterium]
MEIIKPGNFGKTVAADTRRSEFDFSNEQFLVTNRKIDLLFIGDSITHYWTQQAYFSSDKCIVNRGIGGDSTPYLLRRFDAD